MIKVAPRTDNSSITNHPTQPQHRETRKPQRDQWLRCIPVAPAPSRQISKVRRLASRKAIRSQQLTSSVLNRRSREVWRQEGRERQFRPSAGFMQCGGSCAKPLVIGLLCALNVSGECWARKDWRRERNWDPTFSTPKHARSNRCGRPPPRLAR